MQLGTDVHAQLETYHKTGAYPSPLTTPGRLALLLIRDDPRPPSESARYEHAFTLRDLWAGIIDVYDPDMGAIRDYKTTSALKYALNEDTLNDDVQAVLYSEVAFTATQRETTRLEWHYVTTTPPSTTHIVEVSRKRDKAHENKLAHLESTSILMKQLRSQERRALSLQAHRGPACRAYGGCPYKSICDLPSEEEQSTELALVLAARDGWKRSLSEGRWRRGLENVTTDLLVDLYRRE